MTDEKTVRLNIPIDEDLHTKVKAYAAINKLTIREVVILALTEIVSKEAAKDDK